MTTQEAIDYIKQHCNPDYPSGKTEWETAINMAIGALQKQIPQKPVPDGYKDKCPACGLVVKFGEHYCKGCGQKLRWNE